VGRVIARDAARLPRGALDRARGCDTGDRVLQANERAAAWAEERTSNLITDVDDTTREMVNELTASAIRDGLTPSEYAEVLSGSFGFSDERAMMIARTETAFAETAGSLAGYKASGVVEGKEWSADGQACDECAALDGVVVGLEDDFPDDGGDGPPAHPHCECVVAPVLFEDAVLDGETPPDEGDDTPAAEPDDAPDIVDLADAADAAAEEADAAEAAMRAEVDAKEDTIRGRKTEYAGVWDSDGNSVLEKKGRAHSVSFTPDESKLIMDAAVFTHNHPGGGPFSDADIVFSLHHNVGEFRAVGIEQETGRNVNYVLTRVSDGESGFQGHWQSTLKDVYNRSALQAELLKALPSSEWATYPARAARLYYEGLHERLTAWVETDGRFTYERIFLDDEA
jgi:SPP1 gp7 family putative phage head morphogenesis protein